MVCDLPSDDWLEQISTEQASLNKTSEIADAIRDAGKTIAQAILVAFLDDSDRQEQEELSAEQAEIERIRKLQRGE